MRRHRCELELSGQLRGGEVLRVVGRILAKMRLDHVLDRRAINEGREQVGTRSRWEFGSEGGPGSEGTVLPSKVTDSFQATAVEGLLFCFTSASGKGLSTTLPSLENHRHRMSLSCSSLASSSTLSQ